MNSFWKKVELFFDKLIVPALLVLLVIVIADIFFTEMKYQYEAQFLYAEVLVVAVFVGDLSFKFKRAASLKGFIREEWLEIIAIIPFFWVFRLVETVVRVGELVQEIIHIFARGTRLARFFAAFGLVGSRHEVFKKFLRKLTRSERFDRAAEFFKHPEEHD